MVRWFDPTVLFKVIKPVIVSGIFGEYADRRLVHAALDPASESEHRRRSDVRSNLKPDDEGAVWIDYIADTGDGFDSTYAVAYSLAQETLDVETQSTMRGGLLVLGGDQVYPDAAVSTYKQRFFDPFQWAFPNQKDVPDDEHPLLYAVPGNHDWYDGLTLFLAFFCKRELQKVGNWRVPQCRSYFALRLTEKWWLWGVDIGLSEDVDQPQADYFNMIAAKMPRSSKLIICTAAPGWQYNQVDRGIRQNHRSYGSLGYFARIARKANKQIEIPLVLSGDTHHYSRYVADQQGTQFITAGGGGAFLHPTHQLPSEIKAWWFRKSDTLRLAEIEKADEANAERGKNDRSAEAACYPSQSDSRRLVWRNLWFAVRNWKFSAFFGMSYAILGLLMVMWNDMSSVFDVVTNPPWFAALILFSVMLWYYVDDRNWVASGSVFWRKSSSSTRRLVLAISHIIPHMCALTLLTGSLFSFGIDQLHLKFWTWGFNLFFVFAMTVAGGLIAGTIFGLYLLLTSYFLSRHPNDVFSNMSLDTFKNILRIRIKGDQLTLYPIGLDTVPKRGEWEITSSTAGGTGSKITPKYPLAYRLIEGPISIS